MKAVGKPIMMTTTISPSIVNPSAGSLMQSPIPRWRAASSICCARSIASRRVSSHMLAEGELFLDDVDLC